MQVGMGLNKEQIDNNRKVRFRKDTIFQVIKIIKLLKDRLSNSLE